MEQGVLCLKPLYEFVDKYREERENVNGVLVPSAYRSRKYGKQCNFIVSPKEKEFARVPNEQGFYLWGFYNPQKFWINVYLGKAGKGKTANLNARLLEELKDERAFVWRNFMASKDEVVGFDPKYPAEVKRALHKAGSTHIFWVSAPEADLKPENVEPVENDLIEAMNPTANRRRITPSANLQQQAGKFLNAFREMIHSERNRNTMFHVTYHDQFWRWVGEGEPPTP
jgi:hypothetical protein